MIFTCMIVKLILQTIMLLHDMHTPLENGFWGGTLKLLEKTLLGVRKFWFWRGSIFFQGGGCQRFFEKNKKLCNHSIKNQLIFSFSFTFHALQILLHFQYCTSNIMSSLKMWRLFWKEIPVLAKKGQFQWDINFWTPHTAQKTKFSIKDFFSKCDQIRSFLQIWSDLLKKSLMENFTFCAVFYRKHVVTSRFEIRRESSSLTRARTRLNHSTRVVLDSRWSLIRFSSSNDFRNKLLLNDCNTLIFHFFW